MAGLRRRRRPGHHQHPIHDLRPRRQRGRPAPARARADPAAGRAGSSTTRSRSGSAPGGHPDRAERRPACSAVRPGRDRHHQPARDHRGVEPHDRAPVLQRDRLAGHPHRPDRLRARAGRARATSSAHKAGLPPATYFSGGKIQWILENVDGLRAAAETRRRDLRQHRQLADVEPHRRRRRRRRTSPTSTNASRTMLMDLETLDWDDELLGFFDIPRAMLPRDPAVVRRRTAYGRRVTDGPLGGEVPLTGDLGDQQAATVGQVCFAPGEAKNTYGTGNFMLLNTGTELVRVEARPAHHGLLPVRRRAAGLRAGGLDRGHRVGGAVAARPARHHLRRRARARRWPGRSRTTAACTSCRRSPGCSRRTGARDARGAIVGLSRFNTNAHLARATLEAICYQSRDVVEAMEQDSGVTLDVLKVDGGVTANELCMQIQADILGVPVSRPVVAETTALGAAYAAGLAVGFWNEHRRAAGELERVASAGRRSGPTSSATDGLRRLEEGGRAHAGLGGRRLTGVDEARSHDDGRALPAAARRGAAARWRDDRARRPGRRRRRGRRRAARSTPPPVGCPIGLVEARDWASGTSSRSSKLIHGGLRYLEMLDFGLVARGAAGARAAARPARAAPGPAGAVPLPAAAPGLGARLRRGRRRCCTTRWPAPRAPRAGCRATGT